MSYLCSVFPEKVGRKADGKCGGKVRKGPQAGSAVRNARMAEGTEGGSRARCRKAGHYPPTLPAGRHPGEARRFPSPENQLRNVKCEPRGRPSGAAVTLEESTDILKYEPTRVLAGTGVTLKNLLKF